MWPSAHHAVGDGEAEGAVTERLRDTERDDEQTGHRDEHHEANPAFLGLDQAREPRVADPRPPDHREREQPATDSRPVRLGRHQRIALGEAEHEDEIEEELERLDGLSVAQLERRGAQHPPPGAVLRRLALIRGIGDVRSPLCLGSTPILPECSAPTGPQVTESAGWSTAMCVSERPTIRCGNMVPMRSPWLG